MNDVFSLLNIWVSSGHYLKWAFLGCLIDVEARAYVRTASYAPAMKYTNMLFLYIELNWNLFQQQQQQRLHFKYNTNCLKKGKRSTILIMFTLICVAIIKTCWKHCITFFQFYFFIFTLTRVARPRKVCFSEILTIGMQKHIAPQNISNVYH